MEHEGEFKNIPVGTVLEGIIVETFKDVKTGRVRVRPLHPDLNAMKVVFPKYLREDNPCGTRFSVDVKVSQKHHDSGLPNGRPYLYSFEKSIVVIDCYNWTK